MIKTERLILREILPEDADGLFELDSDPEVHRYLGNDPVTSRDQIVEVIRLIRNQYIENGIGRWAVLDKETGAFLGWAGLKLITEEVNGYTQYLDLGYRLIRKYWGQGIATEAAKAWLDYAFEQLKTEKVCAIADIENIGSNKVLEKVGFRRIETFDYDGGPHYWYELHKADYRK